MIKVSVFYENTEGKKFDMLYYTKNHIPMIKEKLGTACKRVEVDEGLGGAQPGGSKLALVAMAHLLFDSVDAFQKAFGPHAATIMGDVPNYTEIQPIVQISNVMQL
jgi:uncharacterized protein (TIGR02118 family)